MEKLFSNMNGNSYAIIQGGKGKKSLLMNLYSEQYVVCAKLEENSWWQGNYFDNFEEAYEYYKNRRT